MKQMNGKKFDKIIANMIKAVDQSKDEIFEITEASIDEEKLLAEDLEVTRKHVILLIDQIEELEKRERLSRNRLAQVSKNFNVYSEEDVQAVYETTHELQGDLKILREREKNLRQKRDYIERRLKSLRNVIERGANLVSKVSIVSSFLDDDFKQVGDLIQDANQKQAFGLKIIEAQEEERLKISREIHDGPAQMLANLLLRTDLVERIFKEESIEAAIEEMKRMREMVRTSLREVRRIIYDLRPMTLDDLGLIPTIRKYLSSMEDYHKVVINFSQKGTFENLESKYEVALFRLIQESVQNAVKHAEPTMIQVNLQLDNKNIIAIIRDDGQGFKIDEKKDQSFGLVGMRERVEMLDGELKINSEISQGTRVYIKLKLKD